MNRSSARGIFLSIALLFSIILVTVPSNAYGEEITVKSTSLEETSLLELTNDSNEEVDTLRIWLGSGFSFKSFKTEKGWIGDKNAQGVIVFTSSGSIKPGESVKFGVKTDKPSTGINWKALDSEDAQLGTGKTIATSILPPDDNPEDTEKGITEDSVFRIIPEKPSVGSTIRVTGDNFGSSQEFDFYIDSQKLGIFETDENGHFITTMKIPDNQKADRVDFKIIDKEGNELTKSLRLELKGIRDEIKPENIPLSISGISEIVNRGDHLEIFGTGKPNGVITAEINTPEGEIINSRTAEIDSQGNWELDDILIVGADMPVGKYSAIITDGRDNKQIYWTVKSDKKIIITPTSLKFEQGETMKFNGTALPNIPIDLVLEDHLGKEIDSDIIQVDDSGSVSYEYPTTQNTPEGTYTLIVAQEKGNEKHKEYIYTGLGQLPIIPVNFEFDKLNYKAGETAIITLSGKASEIVSLLIIDPSDKPKGKATSITLQPDGRATHTIKLDGYASGVYTAVVSKGSAQSTKIFTVGLKSNASDVEINTTKIEYQARDPVLVLGDTDPNVIITLTMTDPDGNKVKVKNIVSDKDGKISESAFRIPSDAKLGTWIINAQSGSTFHNAKIAVVTSSIDGMVVVVEEGEDIPASGDTIVIKVSGAKSNVQIEIVSEEDKVIVNLEGVITKAGTINQPWLLPEDTEPGTYTVKVTNPTDSAETTFEVAK